MIYIKQPLLDLPAGASLQDVVLAMPAQSSRVIAATVRRVNWVRTCPSMINPCCIPNAMQIECAPVEVRDGVQMYAICETDAPSESSIYKNMRRWNLRPHYKDEDGEVVCRDEQFCSVHGARKPDEVVAMLGRLRGAIGAKVRKDIARRTRV